MATPTAFPQANLTLGPPAGVTEVDCASLSVYRCENPPAFISCRKPTADDLERLFTGGAIWIHVFGSAHPPIAVTTEDPWATVAKVSKGEIG